MSLTYQIASTSNLVDLSYLIYIDYRVVHRAFETMAEFTQPADYLYWVHDDDTHSSLHQLPDVVAGERCFEALLERDEGRATRNLPAYWFTNTIRYAACARKMDRM